MITILPITSAKPGVSALLLTSIPIAGYPRQFPAISALIPMAPPSVRPDSAWSTGDSAPDAAAANGIALQPAANRKNVMPVWVALIPLTDGVSTPNPPGMSDSTHLLHGVRKSTKVSITIVLLPNGSITGYSMTITCMI